MSENVKFLNFEFLRYFFHRYLLPSPVYQSFVIIYLFICYIPYFKLVTLKTLVILCNTPKKVGRAFRNIAKNISLYCVISLANFRLLFNLLLIRSSTARGSSTSILSRWSLQNLTRNLLFSYNKETK